MASGPVKKGTICCVLKNGGDFGPEHVKWLKKQCDEHMPDWYFGCWSDMIDVPNKVWLCRKWPKWWSKMEIYGHPLGNVPTLVVDLDTVFVKPFSLLDEHRDSVLIMRDPWKDGFRHPERLGGGFMYLPHWARKKIWDEFSKDPSGTMSKYGGDDQPFLTDLFKDTALRIQDHYIDQLVSYKVHVKGVGLQDDNRVVYFHGEPRPWNVDEPWIPKLWSPTPSSPPVSSLTQPVSPQPSGAPESQLPLSTV